MQTTKDLFADRFLVTHAVSSVHHGERLDLFLKSYYRGRSRETLKRAIEDGQISIDRKEADRQPVGKLKPSLQLLRGDIVRVLSEKQPEPEVSFDYKVLYSDEHICVIDKPANLPVHPAGRFFWHTLLTHMRTEGFTRPLEMDREYFLVHRIDRETSGIMVLARKREVCANIIEQFATRKTKKRYLAIIKGHPRQDHFTVDTDIGRTPQSRIRVKMHTLPQSKGGQSAVTEFKVVEKRGPYSLIECFPKTGRQHQIRVHLDIAGHPIVGDKLYGIDEEIALRFFERDTEPHSEDEAHWVEYKGVTRTLSPELQAKLILKRHALHASRIEFTHPITNEWVKFESDLPSDLKSFFDSLS